jgi:hypothetical protein
MRLWKAVVPLVVLTVSLTIPYAINEATTLADGTTYFLNPPRFLGAIATQDGTNIWSASYYFTLNLPANAGEPLRTVVITQQGGLGRPMFDEETIQAFEGTRIRRGKNLTIAASHFDSDTQTLTVTFDPPVPPGRILTLRLSPVRNPSVPGTYLYGVTAFPDGTKPFGQFIGVGQIRIYDSNQD